MLEPLFDRFSENTPLTVMTRGLIENTLEPETLDELFARLSEKQYQREILFSTMVSSMLLVSCRFYKSPRAVYRNNLEWFTTTLKSFYEKLKGIELHVMRGLLKDNARRLQAIIDELGGPLPCLLAGFTVRILDGNALAGTHHRLEVLRDQTAAALPGKSLVVLDPAYDLVIDVFPCEDGHAQERSLLTEVLASVAAGELWIEDRNFCTLGFLFGVAAQLAFFLVREHKGLPWKELTPLEYVGEIETGSVYEQTVSIELEEERKTVRRVVVKLNEPTRDGETEVALLSNVEDVDARDLAKLYLKRWKIENVFNVLTMALRCEHGSLGYPKAALFGFSTTLLAYNILATIKAALRQVHGDAKVEEKVSTPLVTEHVSANYRGMMSGLPVEQWAVFQNMSARDMAAFLRRLAAKVNLAPLLKAPSKKTKTIKVKPPFDPKKPHVATARLLAPPSSS